MHAVTRGAQQAEVTWGPPESDGGAAVTAFELEQVRICPPFSPEQPVSLSRSAFPPEQPASFRHFHPRTAHFRHFPT